MAVNYYSRYPLNITATGGYFRFMKLQPHSLSTDTEILVLNLFTMKLYNQIDSKPEKISHRRYFYYKSVNLVTTDMTGRDIFNAPNAMYHMFCKLFMP